MDVNEKLIKNLRVQGSYPFKDATIGTSSSLLDLINIGLDSQESAPTVLGVLFTELSKQKEQVLAHAMAISVNSPSVSAQAPSAPRHR